MPGPGTAEGSQTLVSTFVKTLTTKKVVKSPQADSSKDKAMNTIDHGGDILSKDFIEKLRKLQYMYKDHNYPEVDCLFFVYHGYVDVVHPVKREPCYSIGIADNFGESKIVRRPGWQLSRLAHLVAVELQLQGGIEEGPLEHANCDHKS